MKALILGLVVIIVAILTILPSGLGWGNDVLTFLRGSLPVIAIFIGLLLLFVGIADIRDRAAAKKEEKEN
ncbi:MAG: hypothetical protein FWF26_05290 [Treponema sp.]|nr:hypothetical protein [Treponema sp.]